MILFELRCSQGHAFEAWFRDGATYDEQAAAGAISCAICGDGKVGKALMAPALGRRSPLRDGDHFPVGPDHRGWDWDPGKPHWEPGEGATTGGLPAPGRPPTSAPEPGEVSEPADGPKLDPERAAAAMRALRQVQDHIEKTFDHVGRRFAEEARKIHYGEADKRSIYGEATSAEAKELRDEGIEVGQIPWLPRHDG
jgi:hypothetical protein